MLEKMISTISELNVAALHLRGIGDMDGVKKLAKEWVVPYQQAIDFIQGKRYRLADVPVTDRYFETATEKLWEEMFLLDDRSFAGVIGEYVSSLCREDENLHSQVLKKHKSLQHCLDYVTGKAYEVALAQAQAKGAERLTENTGLALSEREVFPWVLEYYKNADEDKAEEKKTKEREKILSEWQRKEPGLSGKKTAVSKSGRGKAKQTEKKETSSAKPEKAVKQETKKKEDFGQLSLFDMQ